MSYSYIPMQNLPANVVCCVDADAIKNADPDKARLAAGLEPLIRKVSVACPHLKIVGRYKEYSNFPIDSVAIFDGEENIGGVEYWDHSAKFSITSRQIRAKLERGRSRVTRKEDVAYKLITTQMQKYTLEELVDVAANKLESRMRSDRTDRIYDYRRNLSFVSSRFEEYLDKNFDKCLDLLRVMGIDGSRLDDIVEGKAQDILIENITKGDGSYVYIKDNVYAIKPKSNPSVKPYYVCNTDTLPTHIKRGIGMLKLVVERSFIKGVGYKLDDNQYFILDEVGV